MVTFEDRNEITVQNPPIGKATLFYDENVLKIKDENGDIRIVTLADSIENAVSSGDYYSNSYVERLKALGSNVQYSNFIPQTTQNLALTDGRLYLYSFYINKSTTITGVGFYQQQAGLITADNYNGFGLYSFDGIDSIDLIASTTSDSNIFQLTTGYKTKDFIIPSAVDKGIYYLGVLFNKSGGFVDPILFAHNTLAPDVLLLTTGGLKLRGYIDASATLPSTANLSTITTLSTEHIFTLY